MLRIKSLLSISKRKKINEFWKFFLKDVNKTTGSKINCTYTIRRIVQN